MPSTFPVTADYTICAKYAADQSRPVDLYLDDTPLARSAGLTIAIPEGREESFAQTRSFAGMLVAVQALGALASGDVPVPRPQTARPCRP